MSMQLDLEVQGLEKVKHLMAKLSGAQMTQAQISALTDTAHHIRRAMESEAKRVFDRPTSYVMRSFQFKPVTAQKLHTTVSPTYYGGKGIDPQKILDAQSKGGRRRDKRMEVALRRIGVLPSGFQAVLPQTPFPGSEDGRGNFRGAFVTQLISYLGAFGEQGYRSNMTDRRRAALHKGKQDAGPVQARDMGRRYFISYGPLRGGRASHLAPGIWAARGTHGVDVRPVVMFTRVGRYMPRYSTDRIARQANAQEYLARRLRYRIRQEAGV